MKLIYVDESGDIGVKSGSSQFFTLCGIAFEPCHWKRLYHDIKAIHAEIMKKHGEHFGEFKGSQLFEHQGGAYKLQLNKEEVQWIYDNLLSLIFSLDVHRFIVVQSKQIFLNSHPNISSDSLKKDLRRSVWDTFLTEIENHLILKSNISKEIENGLIYMDGKPDKHVRKVVLKYARKYDDSSQVQIGAGIVEAPVFVDSEMSLFIQLADILAYSVNHLHTKMPNQIYAPQISPEITGKIRLEVVYPIK